jgi:DNA-binding response OmpR family regulator
MASEQEVRTRRILVVEDEFLLAADLKAVLTKSGFHVLGPVNSVEAALALVSQTRPDSAVLDVNLGHQKVTPLAVHLKELGVPFVLTTASDEAELKRYPVMTGVEKLDKPVDYRRLIEIISSITP